MYTSDSPFVHLHVHSQYSILDALPSLSALVGKAARCRMPALALTDHGNLYGAIDFYKLCKEHHMRPIVGCEIYLAPLERTLRTKVAGKPIAFHLTLLAKNRSGYHNLCMLSSIGFTEGFYYYPRIDFATLARHKEGLICLSGCLESEIAHALFSGTQETFDATVARYHELFGSDFYLELARHSSLPDDLQEDGMHEEAWLHQQYLDYIQKEERLNSALIECGAKRKIPVVATNNVHYLEREEWRAHEILLNVQSGQPCEMWQRDTKGNPTHKTPNPKRATFASHELYFKDASEMGTLFSDYPEALANTLRIAEECTLEIDLSTKHYPCFTPPELEGKQISKEERLQAVEAYLCTLCETAIPTRYTPAHLARVQQKYPGEDPSAVVKKRLEYELQVISSRGMCDYLLIVWDFIHWAKSRKIPMGPGRGSGVGSIILYLTGITDIEPLQFSLFFERFINPERPSYPDIDVDMCMEGRSQVIEYTISKYGRNNVAQIITFGSMKAKMAVKDVGRVLDIPLARVNAIAKLIPDDLNMTLEQALAIDPELKAAYEHDAEVRRIIDIGRKLEGSIRSTGLHAAGLIISGDPLTNHIPVCHAKDSDMLATQYSMKPVEAVGMLKIDFLGLKTLTCIRNAVDAIYKASGTVIDWTALPLDDGPTFQLLDEGRTQGIFQLESSGMQELARNLCPDRFEEIIAQLSLYRPGPMDMIPSFVARKHGREPIDYEHPWLEEILAETYGIMVYQEQVMQIAQRLANYSLGQGDVLRRAMGKKDKNEMLKQRQKFLDGAKGNGISEEVATSIFDKMEKFAEYGFNKSHAAGYGYITYVTAYLKANFPSQWLAALMTCDHGDVEKLAKFFQESLQMGIPVLPPDINESEKVFTATPNGIRFAMSGIKGIGESVVDAIVAERTAKGKFDSLYNFVSRIDVKKVGKKTCELLIDAGCFDFTGGERCALKAHVDAMYDHVAREQKERAFGVLSLFSRSDEANHQFETPLKKPSCRTPSTALIREKELLGFFLTGHPLQEYQGLLKHAGAISLAQATTVTPDSAFRTAFIIEAIQPRIASKSQKKFAILTIGDDTGERAELPIWPEMYEEQQALLAENRLLFAVLHKEKRDQGTQLSCKWLADLTQLDEARLREGDAAYDKAKQARPFSGTRKKTAPHQRPPRALPTEERERKNGSFIVLFDLERLRASHILKLTSIASLHRGDLPLLLRFMASGVEIATITTGHNFSISHQEPLVRALREIPACIDVVAPEA